MHKEQSTSFDTAPGPQSAFKGIARPVLVSAIFFMVICGIAYPLATTGVANLLFPDQARGSLIMSDGEAVGSRLIGQHFSKPDYFHGRPSETSGAPYNAALSGAGNQGAISRKLLDAVSERAIAYREENELAPDAPVPVDAVTASASGLDPHISVANALLQAPRVAKARNLTMEQVLALVNQYTSGPQLGVFGDPRVNVLELNLAVNAASHLRPAAQ